MSRINLNCIFGCLLRNAQQEEASTSYSKPHWLTAYHYMHLTISSSTRKGTSFFTLECDTVTESPNKHIDQQHELESDPNPTVDPAQDNGNDHNQQLLFGLWYLMPIGDQIWLSSSALIYLDPWANCSCCQENITTCCNLACNRPLFNLSAIEFHEQLLCFT